VPVALIRSSVGDAAHATPTNPKAATAAHRKIRSEMLTVDKGQQ
jgi:hypothetical protein